MGYDIIRNCWMHNAVQGIVNTYCIQHCEHVLYSVLVTAINRMLPWNEKRNSLKSKPSDCSYSYAVRLCNTKTEKKNEQLQSITVIV
jgi:hypothetical protein